jgi:hypothetical protein
VWVVSERPEIRGDGQSLLVSRFITHAPITRRCTKTPPSHREKGTGDEGVKAIRFPSSTFVLSKARKTGTYRQKSRLVVCKIFP